MDRTQRGVGWVSASVLALCVMQTAAYASTIETQTVSATAGQPAFDGGLAEAVREALARDPDVRAAMAEVDVAEVETSIARNGYLPSLNASAGPESSGVGYDVSLSQTLYDWGAVRSSVARASAITDRQQAQLMITRNDIALQVAELWLDIAGGRAKLDLTRGHVERLGRFQSMAQERVSGRFSDQAELGRANLAVATASGLRATINGNLAEAEELFTVLVGREAGNVRVPAMPPYIAALSSEPVLEQSIVDSPIYRRAVLEARAADATVREAEASRYPRLVVEGSVQKREIGGRLIDDTSVGLRLRMSTQQGLATFQRPRLEAARRDATRLGVDAISRDLKRTLSSLVVSDRVLDERIRALSDQVSQSAGVRTAYAEQFIVGRRDIQDLIVMESEHFEAERQILELTIERLRNQYRAAAQLGLLDAGLFQDSGA